MFPFFFVAIIEMIVSNFLQVVVYQCNAEYGMQFNIFQEWIIDFVLITFGKNPSNQYLIFFFEKLIYLGVLQFTLFWAFIMKI